MPADEWRKTILAEMHRVLKPLGFKKDGRTFRRQLENVWEVFNLQSSQWGNKDNLSVCVNLGIHYKDFHCDSAFWTDFGPKGPLVTQCQWRSRLSDNPKQDRWWDVKSDGNALEAAFQIGIWIGKYALPTLDDLDSLPKLWQEIKDLERPDLPRGGWLAHVTDLQKLMGEDFTRWRPQSS